MTKRAKEGTRASDRDLMTFLAFPRARMAASRAQMRAQRTDWMASLNSLELIDLAKAIDRPTSRTASRCNSRISARAGDVETMLVNPNKNVSMPAPLRGDSPLKHVSCSKVS